MNEPVIGILTYRKDKKFNEPKYFRDLIREGRGLGANVFLFSHRDLLEKGKTVRGYVPIPTGGWQERISPWPDIVIDRCRKGVPGFIEMRRKNYFPYANHKFTRKWRAMELFAKSDQVKKWIPKTLIYSPETFRQMAKQFPILYIKPGNGTGGSSVVKVTHNNIGYTVLARARNTTLHKVQLDSESAVIQWLNHWVKTQQIRDGNFMVQQGLDLELVPNRVGDTRLLIQKDEKGQWTVTGLAFRVGAKNSPTSNLLHKGGKGHAFMPFMEKKFGVEKAARIRAECVELAQNLVRTIERNFGSMLEFGLDIGVDVKGNVWLIEVNPKPSRDVFLKTGEPKIYKKALQRPIQYAMYLHEKNKKSL